LLDKDNEQENDPGSRSTVSTFPPHAPSHRPRPRAIDASAPGACLFLGPARSGPVDAATPVVTNFSEFERTFGDAADLRPADSAPCPNHLAHAVRAFFLNGGNRLHVIRVAGPGCRAAHGAAQPIVTDPASGRPLAWFAARHPGAALDGTIVEVSLRCEPATRDMLDVAPDGTVARVVTHDGKFVSLWHKRHARWARTASNHRAIPTPDIDPVADFDRLHLRAELLGVDLTAAHAGRTVLRLRDLSVIPGHVRYVGYLLAVAPTRQSSPADSPIVIEVAPDWTVDPYLMLDGLVGSSVATPYAAPSRHFTLTGGSDGAMPAAADYARALEVSWEVTGISIVAAPGYSAGPHPAGPSACADVERVLCEHASSAGSYRYAVLELPAGTTAEGAAAIGASGAHPNCGYYFPWVGVADEGDDPRAPRQPVALRPPTGAVCGMLTREEAALASGGPRGDRVVLSVDTVEFALEATGLALLAGSGINCLRAAEGRTARVAPGVTAARDTRWRDEAIRRYALSLAASIDAGLRWTAGHANTETLWAEVRRLIEDFLFGEWARGLLIGSRPEEAFAVRCGRDTMTDEDVAEGRLVVAVAIVPIRPGDFLDWTTVVAAGPG
jgi:uncharacterized protein